MHKISNNLLKIFSEVNRKFNNLSNKQQFNLTIITSIISITFTLDLLAIANYTNRG